MHRSKIALVALVSAGCSKTATVDGLASDAEVAFEVPIAPAPTATVAVWSPEGGTISNVVAQEPFAGGAVAQAGSVVAGMAAGFRRCYAKGLENDPGMRGSLRVTAKIGPHGEVLGASPSGGDGLSDEVKQCVASVVASKTFDAPEGGGATIVIPVTFAPQ